MATYPGPRLVVSLVVVLALLVAATVVLLSAILRDPLGLLFRHVLIVQILIGPVILNALAWVARRCSVGKVDKVQITSSPESAWGAFRVSLFVATVLVLAG
jgi:hypothetical protein